MDRIKAKLLDKGGTLGDWSGLITNGLQAEDQVWVEGKNFRGNVLEHAQSIMTKDAIAEYECVDNAGRDQGRAVIRLLDWEDVGRGLLKAEHLVASDGYYEWYGAHELKDGKGVYHICSDGRGECSVRLGRADRRELIHLHRWRMTSPLLMMEAEYTRSLALQVMENWVNNFKVTVPEPVFPPVPPGGGGRRDETGLDKEMEKEEHPEKEVPGGQRKDAPREKEKDVKVPKGSVGMVLEKKAAERREALKEKEAEERRRRGRGRSRSRGKRRRRASGRASSGGSSDGRSKSSESSRGFRMPSARGEDEMWRLSQKNPGKLLRVTMEDLSRFLADRAPGGGKMEWSDHRMMAYVSQVLVAQHPPASMGVRNHRELMTLARAIDLLLEGQLPELGDLLVQRLKAVETAVIEQSWSTARHQELIPAQAMSLTSEGEKRKAAKMELSHSKLRELIVKGKRPEK
eukprot:s218_g9.t1